MTAEELAKVCLQLAEHMYEEHDREYVHPTVLHIVHREKHDFVFLPGFGDEASKLALRAFCVLSAGAGADLLAFVSEGWMLNAKTQEEALAERHKVMNDLSLHPARQEVLMIEVKGPASAWSITAKIDRAGEKAQAKAWRSEVPGPDWYNRFLTDLPWKKETATT